MKPRLQHFLDELDALERPAALPLLMRSMSQLDVTLEDVRSFVNFSPDHYTRNLLAESDLYQALIICWAPGQQSPIHDHAGSACSVRVLNGTATETLFDATERLVTTKEHRLPTRSVTGGVDADIHVIANREPESPGLVTMHVYSPPLTKMNRYELVNGRLAQLTPT